MADTAAGDLGDWVRELAARHDTGVAPGTPVVQLDARAAAASPPVPVHAQILCCGDVVVKLHAEGTDIAWLERRLLAIGSTDLEPLWIQPLDASPTPAPDGRPATIWPRVTVLTTAEAPPWAEAGRLLAGLHRLPAEESLPVHGGHARLARAITWLRGVAELRWLADLGEELADALAVPSQTTLVHGDFHLGQLGRTPAEPGWRFLDVDDLGLGDPAWDLARPAGFWAVGLLDDASWRTFLDAYLGAGGPGVPDGDPWPALDLPARAAVVVAATQSVRTPLSGGTADALLAACRRMQA